MNNGILLFSFIIFMLFIFSPLNARLIIKYRKEKDLNPKHIFQRLILGFFVAAAILVFYYGLEGKPLSDAAKYLSEAFAVSLFSFLWMWGWISLFRHKSARIHHESS